jgi:hypothetical protein
MSLHPANDPEGEGRPETSGQPARRPDYAADRRPYATAQCERRARTSMESRTHDRPASADAVEFVRFCYRRRRVGWPELYDEMCGVAGRGLYRGWGSDELSAEGIGFSLYEMPALAMLVHRVVAEEHEKQAQIAPPAVVRAPAAVAEPPTEVPVGAGLTLATATAGA